MILVVTEVVERLEQRKDLAKEVLEFGQVRIFLLLDGNSVREVKETVTSASLVCLHED